MFFLSPNFFDGNKTQIIYIEGCGFLMSPTLLFLLYLPFVALSSHVFIGCRTEISGAEGDGLDPITMSSRVDSAVPTRLSSIRNELIGKKLRVVGKYVPIRS